jgi:transcriptional regulator with XRE-family HTH domain
MVKGGASLHGAPMAKHTPRTSLRTNLAANLRARRIAAGLSQEELSEKSGLDQTYVSYLEKERRNVSLDSVEKLADALGVPPLELLMPPPPDISAGNLDRPQKALKEARRVLRDRERIEGRGEAVPKKQR